MTWNGSPNLTSDGASTIVTLQVPDTIIVGDKVRLFGLDGAEVLNNMLFTFITATQINLNENSVPALPAGTYSSGVYFLNPPSDACSTKLATDYHRPTALEAPQSIGVYSAKNLEHDNRGTMYKRDPNPRDYENGDRTGRITLVDSGAVVGGNGVFVPFYDLGDGWDPIMLINGEALPILWNSEVVSSAGFDIYINKEVVIDEIRFSVDWQTPYAATPVLMDNVTVWGMRLNSSTWEEISTGETFTMIGGQASIPVKSNQAFMNFRFRGNFLDFSAGDGSAPLVEVTEVHLKAGADRLYMEFDEPKNIDTIVLTDVLVNSDARIRLNATVVDAGNQDMYLAIDAVKFGLGEEAELPLPGDIDGKDKSFNLIIHTPPILDASVALNLLDITDTFQCSGFYMYDSMHLERSGVSPGAAFSYTSLDSIEVVSNNAVRREIAGTLPTLTVSYADRKNADQNAINKSMRDKLTAALALFPYAEPQKNRDNTLVGFVTDNKSMDHGRLYGSFTLSIMESKGK